MSISAAPSGSRPSAGLPVAFALIGATALTGCVLAGAVTLFTAATQIRTPASAPTQLVTLAGWLVLVAACWLLSRERPVAAVGTSLVGLAWAAPSLAGSAVLPAMSRAALLAAEPLGLAGLALIARGWSAQARGRLLPTATLLGCAAAAAHLLGYSPFDDPACTLTCEPAPAPLADMLGTRPGLGVSALLSLLAAGALTAAAVRGRGWPVPVRLACPAAAVCLSSATVLPWWQWGETASSVAGEWLPRLGALVATGAVLLALLRVRRIRREVTQVLAELAATGSAPAGSKTRDVHFTSPERQDWVDRHGQPVPPMTARSLILQDDAGPATRMLLEEREDPAEVRAALTAATRMELDNARLNALSRARLRELRASQRRIVDTFDTERTRIERDLHDGAQQRLVAVALHLRAAIARSTPDRSSEIAVVAGQVRAALEALRKLAHGPVPAVLVEEGLVVALRELASASPVPVDLREPARLPTMPIETSAIAYLSAAAALENAARHAQATRATLTLTCDQDTLTLDVEDDGRGGAVLGPGLTEIADRAGALGGHLALTSRRSEGTRVTVVLPCAS